MSSYSRAESTALTSALETVERFSMRSASLSSVMGSCLDVPLHVGGARLLDGTGYVLVHGIKIFGLPPKVPECGWVLLKCWGAKKRRTLFGEFALKEVLEITCAVTKNETMNPRCTHIHFKVCRVRLHTYFGIYETEAGVGCLYPTA